MRAKWAELINRQCYNPNKSLLAGKLYDDKGNVMSPSWSTKTEQYVRRLLELSFLSPKIVRASVNGAQPADCTLKQLLSIHTPNWREQEENYFS